ncbi:hypothetical protein GGS26DRAFT_567027 [Hypomontagnella submonticulosa]|nr:hypothetical protein GGS26DRAFT_567027 [Hypomontagnella submonticulosa]
MAKPVPDIFQELLERHLICRRGFMSADLQVIEAEGFETETPTTQSFVVKPDELEGWLLKEPFSEVPDSGQPDGLSIHDGRRRKLRVILGTHGLRGKYDYMMQGETGFGGTVVDLEVVTLPFSPEHYQLVCQKFHLPKFTSLLAARESRVTRGHCQVTRMPSEGDNPAYGLTMSSFSSLLIGIKVAISMSYYPCTGAINVLLLGNAKDGFSWLAEDLKHSSSLADNPFLVPTLICQRLTEAISDLVDSNFDRLHEVEIGSGQTGILMFDGNGMAIPRGNCEDPNLPVAILGVSQQALAVEAYARGHMLTVRLVKSELLAFPWQQLLHGSHNRVSEQNDIIVKQLDFITQSLEFALTRINHLKQRADVQTTAITNLLAQRNNQTNRELAESSTSIARDTRRDSSAMKSIAILTMVFLPATFTATYFSTPAMTELEPSQSLYWAVTVPLTLVVVFIWVLSFYFWVKTKFLLSERVNSV